MKKIIEIIRSKFSIVKLVVSLFLICGLPLVLLAWQKQDLTALVSIYSGLAIVIGAWMTVRLVADNLPTSK